MKNKLVLYILLIASINLLFNIDNIYGKDTEEKKVIRIGYSTNYGTIIEPGIRGVEGFGYEYFKEIAKYTNYEYEYIQCEWEEGFELLDTGEIDIFGPVGITEERLEKYIYSKKEFGYEEVFLTALETNPITLDDYRSIGSSKVGVEKNSSHIPFLKTYLKAHDIKPEKVVISDSKDIQNMIVGKYDLRLTGSLYAEAGVKVVADLGVEPFYYITNKENIELMNEIDWAMEEIKKKDHMFSEKLYLKYYSDLDIAKPTLSDEDYRLLQKEEIYTIGFSPQHQPLSYINEAGEAAGIMIEVMNVIAKDAEINVEYIPYDHKNTESVDEHIYDLNLCILGDYLDKEDYTSTDAYLSVPFMLIGDLSELGSNTKVMGMLDYSSPYIQQIQGLWPNIEINIYDSFDEMAELMDEGALDYLICTSLGIDTILNKIKETYSVQPLDMMLPIGIGIGISPKLKGGYEEVFNKLIQRLAPARIESIIINNSKEFEFDITIAAVIKANIYLIMAIGIILIILFFSIVLTMSTAKRKALTKMINQDNLTLLISEYNFMKQAKEILLTAKANEYMVLSIDIDNFKYINEVYGYDSGSSILKRFAKGLKLNLKDVVLVTRENADRFLALIRVEDDTIEFYKNRNFDMQVKYCFTDLISENYKMNLSHGMYIIDNPNATLGHIVDCANYARLSGKEVYGNTLIQYTEEMDKLRSIKNNVVSSMEEALIQKEFKVCYQPKVDLNTDEIIGAEALVRWITLDKRQIYPDEFIPIFEKNGFITKLDLYVFEEVCIFIAMNQHKLEDYKISINLSAHTLLSDNLINSLLKIVALYRVDIGRLEIELTESAIIDNFVYAIKRIYELRKLGFTVSMDDFGSGASCLNRLKDINIDILKIDREFLNNTLEEGKGIAIIESIINLSKQLDLLTVAEGVETKEQVTLLKDLGCDIAQGYYFAKPMFEDDFIRFIHETKLT